MAEPKKKILLLVHWSLVPEVGASLAEASRAPWKTEYEVQQTLQDLGHEVVTVGLHDDLDVMRKAIQETEPHIAFNLIEEFDGNASLDQNVVSFLELIKLRYTGCNPRGLMVARDKPMAKKILTFHSIPTPGFEVFSKGAGIRKPKHLEYPLIIKSVTEEASLGISQASIVYDDEKLSERVEFIHQTVGTDAIAEAYIDGREFYVGVLGNGKVEVLPVWELRFENLTGSNLPIATRRAKWNEKYRQENGIDSGEAKDLSESVYAQIQDIARKSYRVLGLSGYARIDLRMNNDGELFLLEANPNPHIGKTEDFAQSALKQGLEYPLLLSRILRLGLRYKTA